MDVPGWVSPEYPGGGWSIIDMLPGGGTLPPPIVLPVIIGDNPEPTIISGGSTNIPVSPVVPANNSQTPATPATPTTNQPTAPQPTAPQTTGQTPVTPAEQGEELAGMQTAIFVIGAVVVGLVLFSGRK